MNGLGITIKYSTQPNNFVRTPDLNIGAGKQAEVCTNYSCLKIVSTDLGV